MLLEAAELDSSGSVTLTGQRAAHLLNVLKASAGLVTGAVTDLIWAYVLPPPLAAPTAGPFAITAAVIGLLAGLFGRLGLFRSRRAVVSFRILSFSSRYLLTKDLNVISDLGR